MTTESSSILSTLTPHGQTGTSILKYLTGNQISQNKEYHFHGLDGYNADSGKLDLLLQGSCQKAFKGDSYIL